MIFMALKYSIPHNPPETGLQAEPAALLRIPEIPEEPRHQRHGHHAGMPMDGKRILQGRKLRAGGDQEPPEPAPGGARHKDRVIRRRIPVLRSMNGEPCEAKHESTNRRGAKWKSRRLRPSTTEDATAAGSKPGGPCSSIRLESGSNTSRRASCCRTAWRICPTSSCLTSAGGFSPRSRAACRTHVQGEL